MGHFAVDDGFDNHPKIRKAGNAAAGLFCRVGAYASRNATEGMIPGPVARDYGTAAQLRKLIELGMLHTDGHRCEDCRQPEAGAFVMHDYIQYNRSRKEIENARKAGSERQRKRRERLAAEAAAAEIGVPTGGPPGVAGGVAPGPPPGVAPAPPVLGEIPRSGPSVTADGAQERARTVVSDVIYVPPSEVRTDCETDHTGIPLIGDRPRIPAAAKPLVDAITAAGMVVGWDLPASDWFLIEALIKRCGIDFLLHDAAGSWGGAREPVRSGRYFIPAWRKLPDLPASLPGVLRQPTLPAGPPTRNQIGRSYLDNVHTGESA